MKKRYSDSQWLPLWVDKWLFGSTRIELTPEERSVWIDLLALGSKDDGYIRANEGCPYGLEQLAGMLVIPKELLERTIQKCLDPKIAKLAKNSDGTLKINNWEKYELSDRHKRRIMSENPDAMSENPDPREEKRREEKIKKREEKITFSDTTMWEGITEERMALWKKAYPACDIEVELAKAAAWLVANPTKRPRSNYGRFLTNWLSRTQDRGGTRQGPNNTEYRPSMIGKNTTIHKPPEYWAEVQRLNNLGIHGLEISAKMEQWEKEHKKA